MRNHDVSLRTMDAGANKQFTATATSVSPTTQITSAQRPTETPHPCTHPRFLLKKSVIKSLLLEIEVRELWIMGESVTPKMHMVPFLQQWKLGCGFYGEQGNITVCISFQFISCIFVDVDALLPRMPQHMLFDNNVQRRGANHFNIWRMRLFIFQRDFLHWRTRFLISHRYFQGFLRCDLPFVQRHCKITRVRCLKPKDKKHPIRISQNRDAE